MVSVESTDVLGNKRASYRDYVELWRHLVDPTKLKASVVLMHGYYPGICTMYMIYIYSAHVANLWTCIL